MRIPSVSVLALAMLVAFALPAAAQNGPAGKNSWLSIRGEAVSTYGLSPQLGSGLTVEWGMLQNKFFGVGTRVGFTRNDPVAGASLLILGGPQAHIALADNFTLMPSLTTGLRLQSNGGLGFLVAGALAAVARFDTFYVGGEGELPLFVQTAAQPVLPGFYSLNLVFGFYF